MEWKYIIPLKNNNSIDEIEKKYEIKLPENLKKCIVGSNAGYPKKNVFDTEKEKERVFKNLLSYNKEDEENIYEFENMLEKGVIPFGLDPFGNIFFIEDKKIMLHLHEFDEKEFIANDFDEFLQKLY